MAARRSNKRTRRGRGRFGFLYQFLSFLIILVVVVLGCIVFFRVDSITVAGQSKYTAQEIIAAAGVVKGDNLFALNKFQIARRIYTGLPYVDEVSISRVLPDGLVLTVSECRPAILVQGGGGWWAADTKGKLLEQTAASTQPGLAAVTGLTALLPAPGTHLAVSAEQSAKCDTLLDLAEAFAQRGLLDKVSAIDLTGSVDLTLVYDGRFTVKLPMGADFARKARALEGTVAQLQMNEKGSIDMTREDKLYVDTN